MRKPVIFWALLLLSTLLSIALFLKISSSNKPDFDKNYPKVSSGLELCATRSTEWRGCLLEQLVINGEINGFNSSINYLNSLKLGSDFTSNCHNLSHQLGYRAFAYYKNIKFINQNTKPGCQGGFIHGVFEEAAQENFIVEPKGLCEGLEVVSDCEHGYGHYLFKRYSGVNENSLTRCTKILEKINCLDGLFMANSLYNQKNTLQLYKKCSGFPDWTQPTCYRNSFYGLGSAIADPPSFAALKSLCIALIENNAKACKEGIGYGSRSLLNNTADPQTYLKLCSFEESADIGCLNYVLMQNEGIRAEQFARTICLEAKNEPALCKRRV